MVKLGFYAGVEYNNKIVFSSCTHNGLYELDMETERVRFITMFKKENVLPILHRAAFVYENEAWFIPQHAKNIARVNLDTYDIDYYEVPNIKKEQTMDSAVFICGKKIGEDKLYLFPRDINDAVIVDMKKKEIEILYSVVDSDREKVIDGVVVHGELVLFFHDEKYYAKVNLLSKKREDIEIQREIRSACVMKNEIWLLTNHSEEVLRYDINKELLINEYQLKDGFNYYGLEVFNECIVGMPMQAKGFFYIDAYVSDVMKTIEDESVWLPYNNKTTRIDSVNRGLFTIGLMACIAEITANRQMIYTKAQIETDAFFDGMSQYCKTNSDWKELYECLNSLNINTQIDLEGLLKIWPHVNLCEKKEKLQIGNMIWNTLREGL